MVAMSSAESSPVAEMISGMLSSEAVRTRTGTGFPSFFAATVGSEYGPVHPASMSKAGKRSERRPIDAFIFAHFGV
jgi:hypothetical protein